MNDWPARKQKIDYDKDDEWVNVPAKELEVFLYNLGTVAEEIRLLKRSVKCARGNYYIHKSSLSELLIAMIESFKFYARNVELDSKGKVYRTGKAGQGRDARAILEEILDEGATGIDGQRPERK